MRPIDADRLMDDFSCTFYNDLDDQNRTEKLINDAPTVKRPHGKWIPCKDFNFCKCSECNRIVMSEERSNFCPNCGASMKEEGDET